MSLFTWRPNPTTGILEKVQVSGPKVFAYSSTAPASAPWLPVKQVRSGTSTTAWTLSDPVTLTFNATSVNSFQSRILNTSEGDGTPTTVYSEPYLTNYDNAYTLWKTNSYWNGRSDINASIGRSSAACGHPTITSSTDFNLAHVGVIDSFLNASTNETLGTSLANAMTIRPVIKSITLTIQRNFDSTSDLGTSNLSGTIYAVRYKGNTSGDARYYNIDTSTTYRSSGTFSNLGNNGLVSFSIPVALVNSIINDNYSIALVAAITTTQIYMRLNGASDATRSDYRGPSSGSSVGSKPTLSIVVDYA